MSYRRCPGCGHSPAGISSSWMYIYKCPSCGHLFCHECSKGSTSKGYRCSKCGTESTEKAAECHAG